MNILNGGAHAANTVDAGVHDYAGRRGKLKEALRWCAGGIPCTGSPVKDKGLATSVGDEGWFCNRISPAMRRDRVHLQAVKMRL